MVAIFRLSLTRNPIRSFLRPVLKFQYIKAKKLDDHWNSSHIGKLCDRARRQTAVALLGRLETFQGSYNGRHARNGFEDLALDRPRASGQAEYRNEPRRKRWYP